MVECAFQNTDCPQIDQMLYCIYREKITNQTRWPHMKKICLIVLLVLWCLIVPAQCVDIVHESFESSGFGPTWNLPSNYSYVFNGSPTPVGNFHAQLVGGGTHYSGASLNFPPSNPTYISWWAKTDSSALNNSYVVIGDANTSTNNGVVFFYFKSTGTMMFYNGIVNYEIPAQPNVWYHIELKNIDYNTKTFNIYIDGQLMRPGHQFRSQSTSSLSQLHLYNFNSGATGYYDQIVMGSEPVVGTGGVEPVSCNGGADGKAWVGPVSGQAPFNFQWSNGATTDTLSGLSAGTYSGVVVSASGCTDTITMSVTEPTAMIGSFSATDASCSYSADGSLEFLVTGGTPGYSYFWNNGDTLPLAQGLNGGIYFVTATDSNGCTLVGSTSLFAPPAILTSGFVTDEVGGISLGAIDLQTGGGTPGYHYLWSSGDTTEDVQGLPAGIYTVEVTDSNGCVAMDTFVVNFLVSNDLTTELAVKVWPVPFDETLGLSIENGSGFHQVELLDLRGVVLVKSGPSFDSTYQIPTSEIAPGPYLLRVSDVESSRVVKVVKH